jgi:hypothetical protein
MNLPDSFYIALCMTVLMLGIVYWFWSQNQFLLRKINLLENIVYELKTICTSHPPVHSAPVIEPTSYPPAPSSVVEEEELHEELFQEEEVAQSSMAPSTEEASDLQPGGVGSGMETAVESSNLLESMTVKELRRLAEQRGIKSANELKKKELLVELKKGVQPPSVLAAFQDTKDLSLSETDVVELSTA